MGRRRTDALQKLAGCGVCWHCSVKRKIIESSHPIFVGLVRVVWYEELKHEIQPSFYSDA